jgi:hypothetical protein
MINSLDIFFSYLNGGLSTIEFIIFESLFCFIVLGLAFLLHELGHLLAIKTLDLQYKFKFSFLLPHFIIYNGSGKELQNIRFMGIITGLAFVMAFDPFIIFCYAVGCKQDFIDIYKGEDF